MKSGGNDMVKVFVRVKFEKLLRVDTVAEEYEAEIVVYLRWKMPNLEHNNTQKRTPLYGYPEPELVIVNSGRECCVEKGPTKLKTTEGPFTCFTTELRVKGYLTEPMELNEFPFDIQELHVILNCDNRGEDTQTHFTLKEDITGYVIPSTPCRSTKSDWRARKFIPYSKDEKTEEVRFNIVVSRRAGFYINNIFTLMILISLLSFATFAVDRTLTPNRLQLTLLLTLTSIAFKQIANQNIPKLSYLTLLDEFILVSMVFISSIGAWHAVISLVDYDPDLQGRMDFWAFIAFVIFYGLFQLIFWTVVFFRRLLRNTEIVKKKKECKRKEMTAIKEELKASTKDASVHLESEGIMTYWQLPHWHGYIKG